MNLLHNAANRIAKGLDSEGMFGLSGSSLVAAYIVIGFSIAVILLSIGLFTMWIYYSWIRRTNSKDFTGKTITEYMFKQAKVDVEVKKSWLYIKYWNYNKRRATHKLRPWTYNRQSIWTLMEAAQQAYATTIRQSKSKQFWMIFRLPNIFKGIGVIGSIGLFYLGLKGVPSGGDLALRDWIWVSLGLAVLFISYTIADAGRVFILWKNVVPLLKDSGLNEKELKAISRIYFWRLVYSVVVVILELIKTAIEISRQANNRK